VRLLRPQRTEELQRVYREHVDAVYAFFAYSVGRDVAEDLTSGTFERVIRSWAKYDAEKGSERTWILTIARNLLTDHYRRSSHRNAVSVEENPAILETIAADDDPAGSVLADDELRRWLAPLAGRDREILALRYAADMSAAEIAAVVELTPANVHQILSRTLRRLRERWGAEVRDSA
jgi:RNA polymerase sigma factor (sigma-70 family)